jgi:hypothetical protein
MDDDISVEDFTGYLNIECTSLYKTRRPAARYVHKTVMHSYCSGQALMTISCGQPTLPSLRLQLFPITSENSLAVACEVDDLGCVWLNLGRSTSNGEYPQARH